MGECGCVCACEREREREREQERESKREKEREKEKESEVLEITEAHRAAHFFLWGVQSPEAFPIYYSG